MEGGAVGAAALGFARMRSRRPRVQREPIDLERIAAAFAEPPAASEPATRNEEEILHALEAEVERVNAARATAAASRRTPEPTNPFGIRAEVATVDPAPVVVRESAPSVVVTEHRPATNVGLPLDQVRAWLEQVQEDLRKVEARVQYLQLEQTRLQSQHHLVAELISSSTPV